MQREALIVFVRKPELGKVKTRLAATIGDAAALHIYQKLLQHTYEVTTGTVADKHIFYAGKIIVNDLWQQEGYTKHLQKEADLGERMKDAFATLFQDSYKKVVIIGSDCPQLTSHHLAEAFKALDKVDVVIGPATDGGYYLLGMKQLHSPLFQNMVWSTATVYAETIKRLEQLALQYYTLATLTDVDEEKDLPSVWKKEIEVMKVNRH